MCNIFYLISFSSAPLAQQSELGFHGAAAPEFVFRSISQSWQGQDCFCFLLQTKKCTGLFSRAQSPWEGCPWCPCGRGLARTDGQPGDRGSAEQGLAPASHFHGRHLRLCIPNQCCGSSLAHKTPLTHLLNLCDAAC